MKMLGIDALNGGDVEGAITHFTSGIKLDCTKTVFFIKRATYVFCFYFLTTVVSVAFMHAI